MTHWFQKELINLVKWALSLNKMTHPYHKKVSHVADFFYAYLYKKIGSKVIFESDSLSIDPLPNLVDQHLFDDKTNLSSSLKNDT